MSELKKNQILPAVCEGYSAEGAGVAHVDGMAVFVSGGIAGERCEIRVLKARLPPLSRLRRVRHAAYELS